ncbi:hypothetical protein P3W55_11345 [Pseudomonas citronellolis]|uniref:Uncharacterized protein n=1 Tax=Pseudomonas citronellolis TaxID=53408 RepID=A0AAW6P6J9_9PSED|nr:hypothetical protein [Pseudomonas citronellolis]MDF3842300.1 hypothetical protein [Pseudomonas citronellolis]
MTIKSVYIDNNVWDFLLDRKMDLSIELPPNHYCLCMTREAEFEIPPIPESKADLKFFIQETIRKCVKTVPLFGFYDESLPADEQGMVDLIRAALRALKNWTSLPNKGSRSETGRRRKRSCTPTRQMSR